jgi:hypothetical protein
VADWTVDGIINYAKLEKMQVMVCSCSKNKLLTPQQF